MTTTQPIAEHLQRVLLFIKLANDGGYSPTHAEVDQYAIAEEPAAPVRLMRGMASFWKMQNTGFGMYMHHGEPVAGYLLRVGWIARHGRGIRLTDLGTALALGLSVEGSAATAEPQGVVLQPDDEAIWATLTREVGRAGAGLLADPYLRAEHLDWVAQATSLKRILTSTKALSNKSLKAALALDLGRLQKAGTDLEMRVSEDQAFHDRYLQHENGEGYQVGASLNGIGKNLTVIMPAPEVAQAPLQRFLSELWDQARPIEPTYGIVASSDEDQEDGATPARDEVAQ